MSDTPLDKSRPTLSDEEVIVDQEIRHPDGSVHRHREAVRQSDPALDLRTERAQLEVDRQLKIRDNDNAARGLLIGVIATTFLGLGILAWYLLTSRPEPETAPVVVPTPSEPSTPSSPPDINITLPNPPAATESTTETAPTQPTVIETQPAPVQSPPASANPPNSTTTAPATDPAPADPAPANSSTPSEPSSSTGTEASTEATP